jgi:hypothetical protein
MGCIVWNRELPATPTLQNREKSSSRRRGLRLRLQHSLNPFGDEILDPTSLERRRGLEPAIQGILNLNGRSHTDQPAS